MKPARVKTIVLSLGSIVCAVAIVLLLLGYPTIKRLWRFWQMQDAMAAGWEKLDQARKRELVEELLPKKPDEEAFLASLREEWNPRSFVALTNERGQQVSLLLFIRPSVFVSGTPVGFVGYAGFGEILARGILSMDLGHEVEQFARMSAPNGRDVLLIATTNDVRQLYAVIGCNLELVRLEQGGKVRPNNYAQRFHTIGPSNLGRTEAEWRRRVLSGTWAECLTALVWLGGRHQLKRDNNDFQESQEKVGQFLRVSADTEVRQALSVKCSDPDPWVQEAALSAKAALEELDPPNR